MGEVQGCYNLGVLYSQGQGVRQDFKKAAELHSKACDGEFVQGCHNLGVSYAQGQGVRQDLKKAKEYFGKACDMGLQIGCDYYKILNK
ncbi:Putative beta-lactamase HcpC [Campylobacter majalis]|uniref:beta-lactamase n=2 Tax=Campylobacter majalis TaxID=2790656 RepID=A0ABN7K901_9BACT|nr:Putative beta-lactamase HcpC [Campylobacter majalis]